MLAILKSGVWKKGLAGGGATSTAQNTAKKETFPSMVSFSQGGDGKMVQKRGLNVWHQKIPRANPICPPTPF